MTRGGQDKSSSPSQRSTQTLDPVINVVIILNCIKNTRKKIFFVCFAFKYQLLETIFMKKSIQG